MTQKELKDVYQFSARLRRTEDLCNFTVPSGEISYSKIMVISQMMTGLRDNDINRSILEDFATKDLEMDGADFNQKLITVKERAKIDANELGSREDSSMCLEDG